MMIGVRGVADDVDAISGLVGKTGLPGGKASCCSSSGAE